MNTGTRPPAVAGSFYSAAERELRGEVGRYLRHAETPDAAPPKCLIVPHAGYVYSGSTAAVAYARLGRAANSITRVILLGPSHRVALRGIALPVWNTFATPLGSIALDLTGIDKVAELDYVVRDNASHQFEHSLEVQLPFLQSVIRDFCLIPLVVGDCAPELVATVIDRLWGGAETLIVCSTDLSHFHTYQEAVQIDADTCNQVLAGRTDLVGTQACGCRPLNGLLYTANKRGLGVTQLAYCNSGDTSGSQESVVGYGAFAIG